MTMRIMTSAPLRKPLLRNLVLCVGLAVAGLALADCGSREERAQAYYEKGKDYLDKKDYVKARIEFRNALQRKGDLVPAWQGLAEIDEQERNLAGLAGDLRKIVELDPKDAGAAVKLARIYLLARGAGLDEALKLVNKAAEIDPKNAEVKVLQSAVLFRLKDVDGATRAAQEALAIDPKNTGARVAMAGIKLSLNDPDGALKEVAALPDDVGDLGAIFMKINIYTHKGDMAQVEALLRRLTQLYPNARQFQSQLAQFYVQQKRPDEIGRASCRERV